ncbi:MAG: FmdB family zinc ribbon protein [bacterium]
MPIYEYKCQSCNKDFEKLIFRREQSICCPFCNSVDVSRIMSTFGFMSGKSSGTSDQKGLSSGSSCASCVSHNCSNCR